RRSGERLLEVANRPTAGAGLRQPALQLFPRRGTAGARAHGRKIVRLVECVLLVLVQVGQSLPAAAELLGQLVELLLGHRPQLPQPALQMPTGLLPAPRRIEQGQSGAERGAPEEPLGGRVARALQIYDLTVVLAACHMNLPIPRRRGRRPRPPARA